MASGDRTNTQKLVTFHVAEELYEAASKSRSFRANRSQWIREAMYEKAAREGIVIPEDAVCAPDRGRTTDKKWGKTQLPANDNSSLLNDAPNPDAKPAKGKVTYRKTPPKKRAKE